MASSEAVMEHLRYHKTFVDADEGELARLDGYMQMVEGELRAFTDPYDKAIAFAFKLVIEEQLDPWSIDLLKFSEVYLERVKLSREIDLVTAGRILLLAWTVLKVQAADLLKRAEPVKPQDDGPLPWDALPVYDPDDPALQDFTTAVLQAPRSPLVESVFHEGERRVTLYELVEALAEARHDVELREILTERRRLEREALKQAYADAPKGRVHSEDLEAEIAATWAQIERAPGPVALGALYDGSRWGLLTAFVALLFLARDGKIRLHQDRFPDDPITVTVVPEADRPAPPAGHEPMLAAEGPVEDAPHAAPRARRPKSRPVPKASTGDEEVAGPDDA